jgi:gliding motility-associated-like protein
MPNIFTPNGDGKNDSFIPIEYKDVEEATIQIYNRWGKLVFESENVLSGWNGRIDGAKAAAGVYFYVLSYNGFSEITYQTSGYITLVR